ncbi:glycoside hydrolase [Auriculariales sp. MPI-PUGE-AT-0066]|nr:glycoside hydrolase [Auriculariales sp. MPI-PUGE-AT-0066]
MTITDVAIVGHTTGSDPKPYIAYQVVVTEGVVGSDAGVERTILKRYSDFTALQTALNAPYELPPKRILSTSLLPSGWADANLNRRGTDLFCPSRIIGLYDYLNNILTDTTLGQNAVFTKFLEVGEDTTKPFDPEDAIPSTVGRAEAADMAAAFAPTQLHATYYPNWVSGSLPPEQLWFGKFDIIYYAFAIPTSGSTVNLGSTSLLKRLVAAAKSSGKGSKIVLSVGGWTGSTYFSQSVNSASNRSKFNNSMASAVRTYGLAGIDIDWEYPNSSGAGNPHSSSDAANFLTMLQGLRANLGSSKIISAAVAHSPWLGSNGKSLTNVSAYAKQMSHVNIMNYDVWGASSTPGPNAPLGNNCGTSKQPNANAQAAFSNWTKAGFPASKLFLGLPLYGYVSRSTKTTLSGSRVSAPVLLPGDQPEPVDATPGPTDDPVQPIADASGKVLKAEDDQALFLDGAHPRSDSNATVRADASLSVWIGQQIPFAKLVSAGVIKRQSDGSYVGAGGFKRGWDSCSTTPFLYNTSQSTFVSFDDPSSLRAKAGYAKTKGMGGTFTWSIDQDYGHDLTDVIRTASGRAPPPS